MEWVILFIVSWALFFLLVDWGKLKINIWCGFMGIFLQLSVDTNAMGHKLYRVENPVLQLMGSSVLFILGPVFVIGILLAQYHPKKQWLRIVNVVVLGALYSVQEGFLLLRKVLIYLNWHYYDSIIINITAMMILSWFTLVVLKEKGVGTR